MNGIGSYRNPIFAGDYADPSILRVGDEFYITHSSFVYHPGLLIWKSRDLIDWEPVTYAVDQPGWDIWAPDLVCHQGRFFIYYFARRSQGPWEGKVFVVHADAVAGPWSAPAPIECGHIDPGHVVGPDGRRWLHLSGGHLAGLTDDGLALREPTRKVYDGWPFPRDRWAVECFGLEGPKLLWRNGWLYLVSAQGGTAGPATSHMVVASRSRTPWGPWEHSPYNPIVHTASRDERWWSRGHGTLVDTPHGDWWLVYHAYEKGFHTLGRQTLMEPVEWMDDGWFRVAPGSSPDAPLRRPAVAAPAASPSAPRRRPLSDDFAGCTLGMPWRRFDGFDPSRIAVGGGRLRLTASGTRERPSEPLLVMPGDHAYEVETEVDTAGLEAGAFAGAVLYYNERWFCGVFAARDGSILQARRGNVSNTGDRLPAGTAARLKIRNDGNEVTFLFAGEDGAFTPLWESLDVSGVHHNVLGGFISLRPGLMAAGGGVAAFRRFVYRPAGV
jgi:beta-xylosidase